MKLILLRHVVALCSIASIIPLAVLPIQQAQTGQAPLDLKALYTKTDYQVPMRDGVKLMTIVYSPRDRTRKYPIMMQRTPYGARPYGPDQYRPMLGPSRLFAEEGYIFVYQDVRGRNRSEGEFKWMTPFLPKKTAPTDVDESTDTWDTIEFLLKNIDGHNGRLGMWGFSYQGHYAAQALIAPHPALKAVSPQAPMADNWIGDDMHHNGAFFLAHAFHFTTRFSQIGTKPIYPDFRYGTPDGYRFFLEMGALQNADKKYFKQLSLLWNEWMEHGDYDGYWKAQNVPQHFKQVKPAVMTVGGWFDAEDLYGTLKIYQAIEKNNPETHNTLVMGPWCHGCWTGGAGEALGDISFGTPTGSFYRQNIELPFFNYFLKDKGELKLPEAYVFETGANRWRTYVQWPPKHAQPTAFYLHAGGRLSPAEPAKGEGDYTEYVSDPAKPVPYINAVAVGISGDYMIQDQRFAATRPDVLVFDGETLSEDVTIAGPVTVDLIVSTSGADADFIVKLIDVYPNDAANPEPNPNNVEMRGYQMLVRGEPMRAKYRHNIAKPEPMKPRVPTRLTFEMPDAHHTFLKGHRIMVQIQSSWFPLIDRNPQKFMNIYKATDGDFQKAVHRVFHSTLRPSRVVLNILKADASRSAR